MSELTARPFAISIVIPAYNEEAVIEATVSALVSAMDDSGFRYELRIVDDGSKDATWEKLQALHETFPNVCPIKNEGPGGYGMAVKAGLNTFKGEAVIVAMADGSDSPGDIVAYARALAEGYDCAFGMRFSGQSQVQGYPPVKRLLNRIGNRLIGLLIGSSYTDFTNGFKGYRRPVIEAMQPLIAADFNLTVEMSIKAVQSGASFKVIPNGWTDRAGGESKFNVWRLGTRYLFTIVYCLLQNHLKNAGARPRTPLSH